MLRAVRVILWRKLGQRLGNVTEMRHADGQDHLLRAKCFAGINSEHETVGLRSNTDDRLIFELRRLSVSKCKSIGSEGFTTHRDALVVIGDTFLRTKLL